MSRTGFEPVTKSLKGSCSTAELTARKLNYTKQIRSIQAKLPKSNTWIYTAVVGYFNFFFCKFIFLYFPSVFKRCSFSRVFINFYPVFFPPCVTQVRIIFSRCCNNYISSFSFPEIAYIFLFIIFFNELPRSRAAEYPF